MHIQHVQAMPMPTPTLQLCIPIRMRLDLDEGEGQIRTVPVINYWDSDFVKSKVLGPCVCWTVQCFNLCERFANPSAVIV